MCRADSRGCLHVQVVLCYHVDEYLSLVENIGHTPNYVASVPMRLCVRYCEHYLDAAKEDIVYAKLNEARAYTAVQTQLNEQYRNHNDIFRYIMYVVL